MLIQLVQACGVLLESTETDSFCRTPRKISAYWVIFFYWKRQHLFYLVTLENFVGGNCLTCTISSENPDDW